MKKGLEEWRLSASKTPDAKIYHVIARTYALTIPMIIILESALRTAHFRGSMPLSGLRWIFKARLTYIEVAYFRDSDDLSYNKRMQQKSCIEAFYNHPKPNRRKILLPTQLSFIQGLCLFKLLSVFLNHP